MLLQLKTNELGGGEVQPPQVQRVFKSQVKIGLKASFVRPCCLLLKLQHTKSTVCAVIWQGGMNEFE